MIKNLQSVARKLLTRPSDLYRSVKNIFHPHNVIVCHDLSRDWCDRDELMFHAMFQILVDFVELEQEFREWDVRGTPRRFTDRQAMHAFIEKHYNTKEGRESMYWYGITDEEKVKADERTKQRYAACKEIMYLYEWYKDKKYDFDTYKVFKLTGKEISFNDNSVMVYVETGAAAITLEEYHDLYEEHEVIRNKMLERILVIRKNLWT